MNDNYDRARWAEQAIAAFRNATSTEYQDALADLLADLIHWADREGVSFDLELENARTYYQYDIAGDAPCKPLP